MIIKGDGNKEFVAAPEGIWDAVCVDCIDLGLVDSVWQGKVTTKHKLRLCFEINSHMDSGAPFIVSKRYTASLHENANLKKDLEKWFKTDLSGEAKNQFDMEQVIGRSAKLTIEHVERDGKTYANIISIKPPTTNLKPFGKYVRKKDRPDTGTASKKIENKNEDMAEDDIKF